MINVFNFCYDSRVHVSFFVLDNVEFGCFVKAMMKEKRFTNYCPYLPRYTKMDYT
jgi:hypothetical protein